MQGQQEMQKKKERNPLLLIHLNVPALTGGLEGNSIQHLLYGYQQKGREYRNVMASSAVMTVFKLQP